MFLASVARASILVSPSVTGSGPYTFGYSIANIGDDPILDISFTAAGLITDLISPNGWSAGTRPVGSDTSITWVSTDIPFDIVDGANLSGFGLTSSSPPGTVVFNVLTESFASDSANTTGPVVAPVPEPRTVFVLGAALVGLYARRHSRQWLGSRTQSYFVLDSVYNPDRLCAQLPCAPERFQPE
jgi:hypothetical protein